MDGSDANIRSFKYHAFISYAREDRALVDNLHARLLKWRAPGPLLKREGRFGLPPRRLSVYMDRKSQEGGVALSSGLREKLEQAAFLIVVCSAASTDPKSWVTREIEHFLTVAPASRIIPVILRDHENQPLEEVLPAPLLALGEGAPIGADLRQDGGIVPVTHKVIGGLTGFSQDDIAREQELADYKAQLRRQRVWRMAGIGAVIVFALAYTIFIQSNNRAFQASVALSKRADEALGAGHVSKAILYALAGLPAGSGMMIAPDSYEARSSLFRAFHQHALADSIPFGYVHEAKDVVFSPKTKSIASIRCFRGNTCEWVEISVLGADPLDSVVLHQENNVSTFDIAPDGLTLVSGATDGVVKLWDLLSHTEIDIIYRHQGIVNSVAYSPNGELIASASFDGSIKVWNVNNGDLLADIESAGPQIIALNFSKTGNHLASASYTGEINIWDAQSGAQLTPTIYYPNKINDLAFSPNADLLAFASSDGSVGLWSLRQSKLQGLLTGQLGEVNSITFSEDGQIIAAGSSEGTIKLWSVESGLEIETFAEHDGAIYELGYLEDGVTLASFSADGTAKLWNTDQVVLVRILAGHDGSIDTIAVSPGGDIIAGGGADKVIKLWDLENGTERDKFMGHQGAIKSVAFSPDGSLIASASGDNTIKLWDASAGKEIRSISAHGKNIRSVVFNPDGSTIASVADDESVIRRWNVETGVELQSLFGHRDGVSAIAFSSDPDTLASGSVNGRIKFWHTFAASTIGGRSSFADLQGHSQEILSIDFGTDEYSIASGSADDTIRIWDWRQELYTYTGHKGNVNDVEYYKNGSVLISASSDGTVKLWDTNRNIEIQSLDKHRGRVNAIAADSSKSLIASASSDGSIMVWNLKNLLGPDALMQMSSLNQIEIACDYLLEIGMQTFTEDEIGAEIFLRDEDQNPCARNGILTRNWWERNTLRLIAMDFPTFSINRNLNHVTIGLLGLFIGLLWRLLFWKLPE